MILKTKFFGLFFILVFMICFFSSCKKNQIIGTWVEVDNQESGVEFTSDRMRFFGENELIDAKIPYKIKGDKIIYNFIGMEVEITYKITDNVLMLNSGDGETAYTRKGK